eukprot:1836053-Amphidinium_carterae.1
MSQCTAIHPATWATRKVRPHHKLRQIVNIVLLCFMWIVRFYVLFPLSAPLSVPAAWHGQLKVMPKSVPGREA